MKKTTGGKPSGCGTQVHMVEGKQIKLEGITKGIYREVSGFVTVGLEQKHIVEEAAREEVETRRKPEWETN